MAGAQIPKLNFSNFSNQLYFLDNGKELSKPRWFSLSREWLCTELFITLSPSGGVKMLMSESDSDIKFMSDSGCQNWQPIFLLDLTF